jgi:carbamoyltransferase
LTTLGLSCGFHSAAAALVGEGGVLAAAAEERFTLQKGDPNFPRLSTRACLAEIGFTPGDLDGIVFYEDPSDKFTRVLASTISEFPRGIGSFTRAMHAWLGRKLWIQNQICSELDVHPSRVTFLPHHESHAAQTFLASPFERAAVLVADAVGEWSSTTLALADRTDGFTFRPIATVDYPHSLGLVYSAATAFLGFRPNSDECSTMALAAFGRPRFAEQVRLVIREGRDGLYSVDPGFFSLFDGGERPFTPKFTQLLGEPRDPRKPLPFDSLETGPAGASLVDPDAQRYADVAASFQLVLEETLLRLARRLQQETGCENLCLVGGVALNCVANARLQRESGFKRIFVPPEPGDAGAAAGAGLAFEARRNGGSVPAKFSPYLGRTMAEDHISALLDVRNADGSLTVAGIDQQVRFRAERVDNEDALADSAARDLAQGLIVGWIQGRCEFGPRALGNRSILVDPGRPEVVARLRRVKRRARFRPYALSVSEERAPDVFGDAPSTGLLGRWMHATAPISEDHLPGLRGAAHSDGTTRPQVCGAVDNLRFHKLLRACEERIGRPGILNTSFNERGYPIVASPHHAFAIFLRTPIDTLIVHNTILRKIT